MNCAACSARVEKAVSAVNGVSECNVNLLTGDMIVEGNAATQDIIGAVTDAGYAAHSYDNSKQKVKSEPPKDSSNKTIWFSYILL